MFESEIRAICIAQVVGITAPAIYSSLTFSYSNMVVPPIVTHAPPRLLAKQWLQAYQYASKFVPPFIISGTLSNAFLAYFSKTRTLRWTYVAAALMTWSIIPVTLLYFEPNVNGAGKWKVQQILEDEGYTMEEKKGIIPSPLVHTARPEARKWAESVEMRDIAIRWAKLNAGRWVVTAIAAITSAVATCNWEDTFK
ncbi:hypothetical protein K504DRAFT_476976 [Pleomassaria siparia CBS 279.74]|uniref:DUF1772-domain-containing protein n=1 Tax=Pleomassaria siparia CBS 279.74 TaxID=1314801 RepID=A0A6G1KBB6_9PLEO|nr:hypothetical protein K504DRAFT_476976 [Pleomassaria siparia CBS 279.74]